MEQRVIASANEERRGVCSTDCEQPSALSIAQQQMWSLLHGNHAVAAAYHRTIGLQFLGRLDRPALRAALDRILARHETLRTRFHPVAGEPVQTTGPSESRFALIEQEVNGTLTVEQVWRKFAHDVFEMSSEPLIRGRLLRVSDEEHVLLIWLHGIFADSLSTDVLVSDLKALYRAFVLSEADPLPSLQMGYADLACWHRRLMTGGELESQVDFWRKELSGAPQLLQLPSDRPRQVVQNYAGEEQEFVLSTELTIGLRSIADQHGVSLLAALMSGLALLLGRWSGQEEVVIGLSMSNRPSVQFEPLIGSFGSILPIRVPLSPGATVEKLLRQVQRAIVDARAHPDVPLRLLGEKLGIAHNLSHSPICQVMLELKGSQDGIGRAMDEGLPGVLIRELPLPHIMTEFDLSLSLNERPNEIVGALRYLSALFSTETIERLASHWLVLLRGMTANPQMTLSHLPLLTPAERRQVINEFNNTVVSYPKVGLLHELFEEQVERIPDGVALVYEDQYLSYGALNERANQLARYLRASGIGPDDLVGICLERSFEMVVGLLGILKSGGAYIPLDPGYPADRLAYMLKDAAPQVLLTQERLRAELPPFSGKVAALDSDWEQIARVAGNGLNPGPLGLTPRNLAYVIYTSGSTGNPKGAMNEHRGVVNRLRWMQDRYGLGQQDGVLQKTPFSFDVSVWEFFWTLSSGARLTIARPHGHQDPAYLRDVIEATEVTTLHFVPSMLQSFLDQHQIGRCSSIRHIICSGEELSATLQRKCLEYFPQVSLSNLYGPTEAAVDVTAWECHLDQGGSRVPIGQPISNIQIYILDRHHQPVPIGISGEIYIGGVGVGRGYLNRPALTAQRFLPDHFADDGRAFLYSTGDLGRWRPDGAIEYLGRNDHQVKLRGFRIELGEIEAQLTRQKELRDAVVLAREDVAGERRLVAYVVPTQAASAAANIGEVLADGGLVQQWQSIYDSSYSTAREFRGPNFSGWNSSYTGLSIPEEQMREWLNCTVSRIRALQPRRVLEIGCGVGLLIEQLAPDCEFYHGTDLSNVAVRDLSEWLSTREHLQHVRVTQGTATDMVCEADDVDTIILNSVAQHFPDVEYLMSFVENSLQRLGPGAKIFIGDVRNKELLEQFHSSVQLAKSESDISIGQLQARIRRAVEEEKQLVISPRMFHLLPRRFPRISRVDIRIKHGRCDNELTVYRYDVVLHVESTLSSMEEPVAFQYEGPGTLRLVEQEVARSHPTAIKITRIENQRLSKPNWLLQTLRSSGTQERIGALREAFKERSPSGEDPEALFGFAKKLGYAVYANWSQDSEDGHFDAILFSPALSEYSEPLEKCCAVAGDSEIDWMQYFNDPLVLKRRERLVAKLRGALKVRLPEYMMPSAFVVLESLPLTPNGKLDRRALPVPDLGLYSSRQYERPEGAIEEALAGIWQDLLRLEKVGRRDNFFELGGHSLLVVQMMARLRQMGLFADVRTVFEKPVLEGLARILAIDAGAHFEVPPNLIPPECTAITPQMLTLVTLEPEHIARITDAVPGGAANIQDIYPLGPLQEGILFHHLLNEQGGDAYVVPTLLFFPARVQLDNFIAALQHVLDRHDILRSAILWERLPVPVQVVHRRVILPVEELSLDGDIDPVEQLKERMRPGGLRFDLRRAPLLRLQVATEKRSRHWYAIFQLHHLVGDQQSLEIVFSEVGAHLKGHTLALTDPLPYRNHVAQILAYRRTQQAEQFFQENLGHVHEPTAPFGILDVYGDGSRIVEAREALELTLVQHVRAQARRLGVSVATVFHAAWGLVVSRTSGRDDIVFGTVLLGRLHGSAGAQRILGLFINTLPLRLQLQGVSVKALVEQTQRQLVELLRFEQTSLSVAQRCRGIAGSTPLFTALLNYRHSAPDFESELADTDSGIRVLASRGLTNYPITLSIDDLGDDITLTAQTELRIDPQRMLGYVRTALQSVVEALEAAPQTTALSLSILPGNEWSQLIKSFNATQTLFPETSLVHQIFEEQAQRTPDAIAIEYADQCLSYSELDGRATQLARNLRDRGVSPDSLVALCVERSTEMVVGLLAILKAGAAYVPLDPNYPAERLQYMLADAAPALVLTQDKLREHIPEISAQIISLDTAMTSISGPGVGCPSSARYVTPQDPVYVIYTSGSTGQPKGTVMPHRSMVNLIEWHRQSFGHGVGRRVLQFAALSFDVAFQETFCTLGTGGTLVLLDEWVRRDASALTEFLSIRAIQTLFVPPLVLQSLAEHSRVVGTSVRSLQDVIAAGEQLNINAEVADFFGRSPGCRLHNHYGPTETHVVTTLTLTGDPGTWPSLAPIGRPTPNTQLYILDSQQRPTPMGVVGEIYIGGTGLALGYLNRPQLTAQRFIADPFSTDSRARLYRTGDLGRWRSDGVVEYLGRNDDQVKIRGFRIELGEVETQLLHHHQVKEVAVVAREDVPGTKRLVAYVVPAEPLWSKAVLDVESLRSYLKAQMPEYMVPSAFVKLEHLPLTANGKLDRRSLPAPEMGVHENREFEAPRGRFEVILAEIWREVLGVEHVNRQDNFFELGGHSLTAMKLIVKVADRLSMQMSVSAIFRCPTLQELGALVEELGLQVDPGLELQKTEHDEFTL